ncbi:MAG TPA: SRPBCC domain-containing protein [Actinomycetota bacterium]
MGDDREVRRGIVLPARREEVWDALTDPERLADWFGGVVSIEPRPRGRVTVREPGGTERRGVVVAAGRPYRLVVEWEASPGRPATRVEFVLEDDPSGTTLTVTEGPSPGASNPVGFLAGAGSRS